nr:hypothetical protein Iba_chr04cCG15550 [Ipomoea batatas]
MAEFFSSVSLEINAFTSNDLSCDSICVLETLLCSDEFIAPFSDSEALGEEPSSEPSRTCDGG